MSKPTATGGRPPPGAPAPDERLVSVMRVLLAAIIGLHVINFLWQGVFFTFLFPYQLDYGEGPILQLALRVARGQELYPPIGQGYPYIVASYPPLYYLVSALGAWITGPSFIGGRLVSLLSALVVAVCAGLIVWDRTKQRFAAMLTGGLILSIPVFLVWSTLMRIDMSALAFSVAGFYLFDRGRRLPAIVLFTCAALTRWTNLAAIAASFAALFMKREWKAGFGWAAAQLGLILVAAIGSHVFTRGGMYEQLRCHTSTSLGNAWTWGQLLFLLSNALRSWPVFFAVGILGALWCIASTRDRVLAFYFIGACAIYLTSGRIGSSYNYFLEPLAVGVIMLGVLIGALHRKSANPWARTAALVLIGAIAIQMAWNSIHLTDNVSLLRPIASVDASRYVVSRLREAPGKVLCEDVGLTELAGKEVLLDPFEFTQLARAKIFDPQHVYDDVSHGRFSLIVFRCDAEKLAREIPDKSFWFDRWPMEVVTSVAEHYHLDCKAGPYYLYVPESPPVERE